MTHPKKVWSAPIVTEVVLHVCRKWMDACGYRSHRGVWDSVIDLYVKQGFVFADVVNPSGPQYQPFTVALSWRDAKFVPVI